MPNVTIRVKDSTGIKSKIRIKCEKNPSVEAHVDDDTDTIQVIEFSKEQEDEKTVNHINQGKNVVANEGKNVVNDEESKG